VTNTAAPWSVVEVIFVVFDAASFGDIPHRSLDSLGLVGSTSS